MTTASRLAKAFQVATLVGVVAGCPLASELGDGGSKTVSDAGNGGALGDGGGLGDGGDGVDAGDAPDAGGMDASSGLPDANVEFRYSDMTDGGSWSLFDLEASVNPQARVYQGSAFDGRFLYLIPISGGVFARYDTRGPFSAAAWSTVSLRTLNAAAVSYVGAVFDGTYVYLVPFEHGLLARFDTRGGLADGAAWAFFDLTTVDPNARGYFGGAFDGRFLYLSPFRRGGLSHGLAARLDTRAPFGASAWTLFNIAGLDPRLVGFDGAAYDGRFVYYTPYAAGTGHTVARFDSTLAFTQNTAWSWFDVQTLDPGCIAFQGSIFDGRFLYFVPWNGGRASVLARYDTTAAFAQRTSWSTFDLRQLDARATGFVGGQFDGRFVYFSPYGTGMNGLVVRFDTTRTLSDLRSWSKFDLTTISPNARGYGGAGFDGRYVYFVPEENGTVARFDSKVPPSLPPLLGSFQ